MRYQQGIAERITLINIIINIVLAVLKLAVGALSGSQALVSDGVHSVTDIASSAVVLIGIRLSHRRSDPRHPYGHERIECVAAILLAVLVGVTGVGIGVSGVRGLISPNASASPGFIALTTAVFSVVVKELMFRYTKRAAMRSGSAALLADAWHLRTDALSSLGSVIGVVGAVAGAQWLDPLMALLIGLLIIKAAVEIFMDAIGRMIDRSCDPQLEQELLAEIAQVDGVVRTVELKTRLFGNRVLVEVSVAVADTLTANEAYAIVGAVQAHVGARFETVKECSVHIVPISV